MTTRTLPSDDVPSDDVIDRACDAVLDGSDDAFFDGDDFAAELALVAGELTAFATAPAPMPASLRERLLTQIDQQIGQQVTPVKAKAPTLTSSSTTTTTTSGAMTTSGATKTPTTNSPPPKKTPWARSANAAWAFAAAAAVVAILGWWPKTEVPTTPTTTPTPTTKAPPTLAELRTQLLAQPGTTTLAFGATADIAARGAEGDVVWNNATQTGFMRIRGLAKNQATIEQYQLWIFDAARDDRYPVDGGVFDIDGDDVIVAIHAAIDVRKPALFAVTVEKPGGVVVSDRSRIVLAAKVG